MLRLIAVFLVLFAVAEAEDVKKPVPPVANLDECVRKNDRPKFPVRTSECQEALSNFYWDAVRYSIDSAKYQTWLLEKIKENLSQVPVAPTSHYTDVRDSEVEGAVGTIGDSLRKELDKQK